MEYVFSDRISALQPSAIREILKATADPDVYKRQDIFCVWLDGACGEGPNGKVQKYDWNGYYACLLYTSGNKDEGGEN